MKIDDVIKILPIPMLGIVVAYIFSLCKDYFDDDVLLIAILITLLIASLAITFYTVRKYTKDSEKLNRNINENSEVLKSLQETIANSVKFQWILTGKQLIEIERKKTVKCKEIWIVTPELSSDTGNSAWIPAIQDNINQGISYKYICADQPGIQSDIKGMKTTFSNNLNKCFISIIAVEEFKKFSHKHIVVYDPDNSSNEMDCYAEIDASNRDYWFQLVVVQRNAIIDKLSPLIKKAKTLSEF
jgi:hypothetical protein